MNNSIELYATGMPFPEGPAFGPDGLLYICVRRHGWIARVDSHRTVHHLADTGGKPQAFALSPDGILVLADALRKQILTVATDGRLGVFIDDPQLIGPNDLTFGPISGDLYFTDPGNEWNVYNGSVYRYSMKERRLTRLAGNLGFPNGLAVTSDEQHVLVGESLSDRLLRIDLQNSGKPEVACQFAKGSIPDGMEWLTSGHLAIAQHGLGHITLFNATDGSQQTLRLPLGSHPTNLIQKENDLFVTDDIAEGLLRVRWD